MKIIHTFFKCLHCNKEIEIFDDDWKLGEEWKTWKTKEIECPNCGYQNDTLNDNRITIYERAF